MIIYFDDILLGVKPLVVTYLIFALVCILPFFSITESFGKIDPEYWLIQANNFSTNKSYEIASLSVDKFLDSNANSTDAFYLKGRILYAMKKYEDAIICFDKVIKSNPLDYNAWYSKGEVLDGLHRYQDAISCYDNATVVDRIIKNKFVYRAWINKGLDYYRLGLYKNATECYNKSIYENIKGSLGPNPSFVDPTEASNAWNNKGIDYVFAGNNVIAYDCFNNSTSINPQNGRGWINEGLALISLNKTEKAIRCFETANKISNDPETKWLAFFSKGIALKKLGHYDDAENNFSSATYYRGGEVSRQKILDNLKDSLLKLIKWPEIFRRTQ
jgi:tetratricopeptide (TPR) repeat protein